MGATEAEKEQTGNVSQSPEASLSEAGGSSVNERSLLRKIDAHLLPAVA